MSEWAPKVFWTDADVAVQGTGFTVLLDGRPIRTPAKAQFCVPTRALAEAVAEEWGAQKDHIDPTIMPLTRMANAAIDKLTRGHAEVCDLLAAYGDSDLLCYRAESPIELVARQAERWDPILDWGAEKLGAQLDVRTGIMPKPQASENLSQLAAQVHALDPYELSAFHDFVVITGSLILGFAILHEHENAENAFKTSRIDESFQREHWGVDEEAIAQEAYKLTEIRTAERFLKLAKMA